MDNLQAPWVGKSPEEYYGTGREEIGYCSVCGETLYDGDDVYDTVDGHVCQSCYEDFTKEEEI